MNKLIIAALLFVPMSAYAGGSGEYGQVGGTVGVQYEG